MPGSPCPQLAVLGGGGQRHAARQHVRRSSLLDSHHLHPRADEAFMVCREGRCKQKELCSLVESHLQLSFRPILLWGCTGQGLRGGSHQLCTRGCCLGTATTHLVWKARFGKLLRQRLPVGTHVYLMLRFSSLTSPCSCKHRVPMCPRQPTSTMCSP